MVFPFVHSTHEAGGESGMGFHLFFFNKTEEKGVVIGDAAGKRVREHG